MSGFEALEQFQNLIGFLLRFSIETTTEGGDLFAHNALDAWLIRCSFSLLLGGFMKNAFRKVGVTVAVVLVACVTFATPVGATARMPQVIPANSVVAAHSPQKVEFLAQVFQAVRVYAPVVVRQITNFVRIACPGLNSSTGGHPQALAPLTENSLD